MSKEELIGVGARLRADGYIYSAEIVEQAVKDIANLKILVVTGHTIVDKELLPNVATMAIQDFGRLNEFMMDSGPIKKELEND